MHGVFIIGLKELVINKFDESFWSDIIEQAGLGKDFHPLSNQELADDKAVLLIKTTVKKLNLSDRQFGEIFGNYWIKTFARLKYFAFFDAFKSSRDFINQLSVMHQKLTQNLKEKKSPVFDVSWKNQYTAIINYNSERGLIHIAVGLLKALGDYYNEEISVYRVNTNQIKVFYKV